VGQKKVQRRIGACILAGGLNSRMGRDKARLVLGGRSLLTRIRRTVEEAGFPCRVLKRDAVPRCGPLGGILTGLSTSRADAEIFLACDMPFITGEHLLNMVARHSRTGRPVFSGPEKKAGFPCILPGSSLELIENQIRNGEFSLQKLANVCRGEMLDAAQEGELLNLNTPDEFEVAKALVKKQRRAACKSAGNI
jgi:molybdopterin-guanine dinucleotide biosynthesis protein A